MLTSVYREILDNSISGEKINGGTIDYVQKIITNELQLPKTAGQADGYIIGDSFEIGHSEGAPVLTPIGLMAAGSVIADFIAAVGEVGHYIYDKNGIETFRVRYFDDVSTPYTEMRLTDELGLSNLIHLSSLTSVQNHILYGLAIGTNTDIAPGYMFKVDGDTYLNGKATINGNIDGADVISCNNVIFQWGIYSISLDDIQAWIVNDADPHITSTSSNPHQTPSSLIQDDSSFAGGFATVAGSIDSLYSLITASVSASGIIDDSGVTSPATTVAAALSQLDSSISSLAASDITDDSSGTGPNVDDTLTDHETRVTTIENNGANGNFGTIPIASSDMLVYFTSHGSTPVQFSATDRSNSFVKAKVLNDTVFFDIKLSLTTISPSSNIYFGVRISDITAVIGGSSVRVNGGVSIQNTSGTTSRPKLVGAVCVDGIGSGGTGTQYLIFSRYDFDPIATYLPLEIRFTGTGVHI